jgi:hypothetical protein
MRGMMGWMDKGRGMQIRVVWDANGDAKQGEVRPRPTTKSRAGRARGMTRIDTVLYPCERGDDESEH